MQRSRIIAPPGRLSSRIVPFSGEKPVGYIFYNHDGYMSVEIMAAHRAPYQAPDVFGGTTGKIGGNQHVPLVLGAL